MSQREPMLGVACGKKGVGKSYQTEKLLQQYVKGNPAKGVKPRRVLIFDVNNEYSHIKTLNLSDVVRFSVHPIIEIRRIVPLRPDGKNMTLNELATTLNQILDGYRNGLLLIEDINKYISDNLPNDVVGAICTNRHLDLDIIMHFQSIGRITPKIWQNLSWMRFHKNTESVERHKRKFEDKYELLSIVENIVNNRYIKGDKRYFVYVNVEEMKVITKVSEEDRVYGIQKYISERYNKVVTPLLRQKSMDGKKKIDQKQAQQLAVEELTKLYF